MTLTGFDPQAIIEALDRHHVDYVVVGGYAANVHGAVRPTTDIDLAPATTHDNLTRLAATLRELEDIITSKTEAGRQKDLLALPELRDIAARRGG